MTGGGQHIEVPMIDLAVKVAAEQILEFEAYGELMTRRGNRSVRAAPPGRLRMRWSRRMARPVGHQGGPMKGPLRGHRRLLVARFPGDGHFRVPSIGTRLTR